ncbi:MAG: alpha/beta fold hydrolase [Oscillospiraceae bacterium]|nr:alpha/beta fold hydrolase [Oscillospiraceae bacterium]
MGGTKHDGKKKPKDGKKKPGRGLLVALALLLVLAAAFFGYTAVYYHADATALAALGSDATVRVSRTAYGWLFDGPSETDALIFYPGGKVEATAYAPLLRQIAAGDMDVCLVEMPFRLAVLAGDKADEALAAHDYANWYIGGHSLGGAMAANYAAAHGDALRGLVLLGAYATRPLDGDLQAISIWGSEDGVVNRDQLAAGRQYLPADAVYCEIPGGDHAQFGSYGPQRGDGTPRISPEEQWAETAALIRELPDRAA